MAKAVRIIDVASAVGYLESVGKEVHVSADGMVTVERVCSRCWGTGSYSYNPTDGDRCFGCTARGGVPRWNERVSVIEYAREVKTANAKAERDAKRAAEYAALEAAREAAEAQREEARPALIAGLVDDLAGMADAKGWIEDFAGFAETVRARQVAAGFERGDKSIVGAVATAIREEKGRALARKPESYLGTPGERMELQVTLKATHQYARKSFAKYGQPTTGYVVKLEDSEGRSLVWFTSHPMRGPDEVKDGYSMWTNLEEGATVRVKATVKAHDKDQNGAPQTVVTRVALA